MPIYEIIVTLEDIHHILRFHVKGNLVHMKDNFTMIGMVEAYKWLTKLKYFYSTKKVVFTNKAIRRRLACKRYLRLIVATCIYKIIYLDKNHDIFYCYLVHIAKNMVKGEKFVWEPYFLVHIYHDLYNFVVVMKNIRQIVHFYVLQ